MIPFEFSDVGKVRQPGVKGNNIEIVSLSARYRLKMIITINFHINVQLSIREPEINTLNYCSLKLLVITVIIVKYEN